MPCLVALSLMADDTPPIARLFPICSPLIFILLIVFRSLYTSLSLVSRALFCFLSLALKLDTAGLLFAGVDVLGASLFPTFSTGIKALLDDPCAGVDVRGASFSMGIEALRDGPGESSLREGGVRSNTFSNCFFLL